VNARHAGVPPVASENIKLSKYVSTNIYKRRSKITNKPRPHESVNKTVLRCLQKVSIVSSVLRRVTRRSFHARGPVPLRMICRRRCCCSVV